MNILMIAGRLPLPPLDGGTSRVYHLARKWSARHQITLVAPHFAPIDQEALVNLATEMNVELHAVPSYLPSKQRRLTAYAGRVLRGFPPIDYYPEVDDFLKELVRNRSFDVIEFEGSGGGSYLSVFANLRPRPRTILVFYDVMYHWWKREFLSSPGLIPLMRWLSYRIWEPKFVHQVDCAIFVSEIDITRITKLAKPQQLLVVPNGIDTRSLKPTPLPGTLEILFVGSFTHGPNRQAVIWLVEKIWPELRRLIPEASLTVVGREPTPDLVVLTNRAGVSLHGSVPDVRPYYARAAVVVAPILTGGGTRIKILEALAAGRPVVTTSVGAEGLPLVPGRHALFADTAPKIAEALARLLTDLSLAQHLATNGRLLVEQEFDWAELAQRQEKSFIGE